MEIKKQNKEGWRNEMVSLFDGIENGELEQLLPSLGGRRVFFDEGEYILMAGGRHRKHSHGSA